MPQEPMRIVIIVDNGIVQGVYGCNAEYLLIDRDDQAEDPEIIYEWAPAHDWPDLAIEDPEAFAAATSGEEEETK